MKKAALIMGSPRKNSNTHILLKETQKGLKEKDIESRIFFLNDMDIKACQACYYCKKNKTTGCALKDDMKKITDYILEAEGLVVASPIYFGYVTAQTKLFTDRLFPFIDMNVHPTIPKGKKVSFIFTQNQTDTDLFHDNIDDFMTIFKFFGFIIKGHLLVANLDKGIKPMVTEDQETMQKAYDLGANLIS